MNDATVTRARPAKPLEPVSEVTKSKLNAFNFCPPQTTGTTKSDGTKISPANDENKHDESGSSAGPSLPATEKSTGTPVSRLAWQDLLGAPQPRDDDQDVNQDERILWDTRHDQSYKASPMMPRKRGKKRARSSSPVSSPAAKSKSNTPVVNVKKLAAALRSPHADPALELWDRFALSGSTSATPSGTTNPALAQIMVSSSPRPSKMMGAMPTEGGLRRTISCGTQWPKRRRTDRADPTEHLEVMAEESPSRGASKSSMVNALLRSVTGEINRSKADQTRQEILGLPSPRKKRRPRTPPAPSSSSRPSSPSKPVSPPLDVMNNDKAGESDLVLADGAASDYGDDDFDDDALMELGVSLVTPHGEADEGDIALLPLPPPPPLDTGQKVGQTIKEDLGISDDEFADFDDDVLAVAEDIITQLDSNHTSTSNGDILPQTVAAPQNKFDTTSEDLPEDMYGDDFGGDFDFEAAEIAATQSAKQTQSSGSLPVRRWQ